MRAGFIWLRTGFIWQDVENMIMNLWVPRKFGKFFDYLSVLLVSEEGFCCMQLL
jgi:hypothetical protein